MAQYSIKIIFVALAFSICSNLFLTGKKIYYWIKSKRFSAKVTEINSKSDEVIENYKETNDKQREVPKKSNEVGVIRIEYFGNSNQAFGARTKAFTKYFDD